MAIKGLSPFGIGGNVSMLVKDQIKELKKWKISNRIDNGIIVASHETIDFLEEEFKDAIMEAEVILTLEDKDTTIIYVGIQPLSYKPSYFM